jgi:preprotein translocase subunit SecE
MIKKVTNFLTEVKAELTKVSWSNRQELIGSTTIVLLLTALMTVFIAGVDILLSHILKVIFKA